ncbi:MAG TPA: ATP-binding protein [Gemmatimonadales bacterium]|jgi:signal transduction histidine kinase|nr:ATP-binding protein [Gemmatimonadales bacterium]
MRSFRSALAFRVAVQALGVAVVALVGATLYLRGLLLSNIDASLLEVAQLQAQYGASRASGEFRFGAGPILPTVGSVPAHESWAQVLSEDGVPIVRDDKLRAALPVPTRALETARRGQIGFATHRWLSGSFRSVIYPLSPVDSLHRGQLLQVAASLAPLEATLTNFVWLMAGLGLLGVLLAGLVGYVIAGRVLTPALALTAEAESIGVNELGRRVTLPGDVAEFDRMAVTFNGLLERLEQAIKGTRRFTSDASHELRAPLTVLRGELELALSRPRTTGEYEAVLRRCLDEVLRLTRLADDLLMLTRIQGGVVGGKRSPVELAEVVERAVGKKTALAETRGVTLEVTGSAGLVSGDADLLVRAVDGLVEHAIMASPAGGRVRVRLLADHRMSVEVTDGGPGLKPDEVSGVFQRFYRSNRPRISSDESGLGLPIARAVALSHGGALEYVGNDPGASFRLSLPASR